MWPWESKAAVDERFYADNHTTFTVTRSDTWRGPGFNVVNSAGGPAVMHARTVDLGNGTIRSLVLLDAASHAQIVSVQESWLRVGSGRWHRQWEAFRSPGATGTADRLFVAVDKTRLFQMGNTVHVFLHGNSSGGLVPDFVVRGSYCYGTITVSRGSDNGGDDSVAQIRKESGSWMVEDHAYTVWIHRGVDQVFILALAVILDQILNPVREKWSCHFECNKR